jgi:hypothetical protein
VSAPPAPDLLAAPDLQPVDKAAHCASTFGAALTNAFGRLDGTLLAVIPPGDMACAMPNSTHLILEVTMGGDAYRMVVNVLSDVASPDPRVRMAETQAPLAGGAFAEGWHPNVTLDYVQTLGVHAPMFTPWAQADLVQRISDRLQPGDPISVYATSSGGASAHLVHRNAPGADGAIVVAPTSASPDFILLAFDTQSF